MHLVNQGGGGKLPLAASSTGGFSQPGLICLCSTSGLGWISYNGLEQNGLTGANRILCSTNIALSISDIIPRKFVNL